MLQFSLLLPQLNQLPLSSRIVVFAPQSALSDFVQPGILLQFRVSSLSTRPYATLKGAWAGYERAGISNTIVPCMVNSHCDARMTWLKYVDSTK